RTGRIALTCDYDQIATEVIALLKFRRFDLIEMATEELAAMLLGVHRALECVEIRLDKPAALDGRAKAASVEITRSRSAFPATPHATRYGVVEQLLETRDATLSLHGIDAGRAWTETVPRGARVLEWLVDGSAARDGAAMERHAPLTSGDEPVTYAASGS